MAASTNPETTARRIWRLLEPVHAVTYFTAEALQAFTDAGLRGFWRGYFAGRSAPLGPVGAAPVLASFYSFAPVMVDRALPAVWDMISPAGAITARAAGAGTALRTTNGALGADALDPAALAEVNDLLATALARLDHAGRVLGAVNAALPVPDDPWQRLWQAATTVREHRGDGHIAALVATGLSALETLAWRARVDLSRTILQAARGWTDEEWTQAEARLTGRGWLDPAGQPTQLGIDAFREIERRTDLTAATAWAEVDVDRLGTRLGPLSDACLARLPSVNPIGLPGGMRVDTPQ